MTVLATRGLSLRRGDRLLYRELSLTVRAGEIWAVLGPNGVGKSSLLQQLAGLLPGARDAIELDGRPLHAWTPRQLARHRALILQEQETGVPMRVWDRVLLGRHPYLGRWGQPGAADLRAVRAALAALDLLPLAGRWLHDLSGGERQRVALAAAMVQEPMLWLADEPNNHLDPLHQVQWLQWLRARVDGKGGAALLALHDLNLAARFCNHALLLYPDGRHRLGSRAEVLRVGHLSELYACSIGEAPGPGFPVFYWGG